MTEEVEKPLDGLTDQEKSNVITNAVKEIDVQDILVCGKCHKVYHFLEEFKEHKESETCKGNGEIKETLKDDKKPQIWAFTLWKNTKFKNISEEEKAPTSWNIYQNWRAMKANEKQAWLTVAGDMQGLFEIVGNYERSKLNVGKIVKTEPEAKDEESKKAAAAKPFLLNTKASKNTRRAVRTGSDPKVEHLVEKMISKRYNPRKKTFEYLIKWEHFDTEKNTWESTASLLNCKTMLEEFDKNLQIQKEQMKIQKTLEKKTKTMLELKQMASESRPQRKSKQNALNQVKAWCGAEAEESSGKRVYSDDSDEDESYEKRMKVEESSSDSENDSPVVTIKRITKNGIDKKTHTTQKIDTITLPDNILIPDAKGIVRINQKQIPSLSSGVYVMSKTAGIIKLDTAAASKLTGGGQTVLKVAPKMGQTSIKLIKKDVSNGNTAGKTGTVTKTIVTSQKPVMRNYSGKVYMQKRTNAQAAAAAAAQAKKIEVDFEQELEKYEEESDGVEELEFPSEIHMPTAESPPPEFTLCPLTGKVVDKDGVVVESEDVEDEIPEIKIDIPASSTSTTTVTSSSNNSFGNLVSLAAADILDDLTDNEKVKSEPMEICSTTVVTTTNATRNKIKLETGTPLKVTTIQKSQSPPPLAPTTPSHNVKSSANTSSTTSILSTALTNANIVRRGPPKLVPRSQPRPGILQTTRPLQRQPQPATQAIITRITPGGTVQQRMPLGQQGQVRPGTTQIIRKRVVQQSPGQQQQQGGRSVVRQTRVYQQVVKSSPQVVTTYVATPTSSNKIITMPALVNSSSPIIREKPVEKQNTPAKIQQQQQQKLQLQKQQQQQQQQLQQQQQQQQLQQQQEELAATTNATTTAASIVHDTTSNTISLPDNEAPLLITGEDGTIYQVAGQNEDGQTILLTHGEDGEQQCLLVAPENASLINQALMKPSVVQSQEVQEVIQQPVLEEHQEPLTINTAVEQAVDDQDDSQVVAQIVSANPPSPGGTRKVVLMLPDGSFMMTEVTAEQYAALELDK